jgi:hypothetical protein
MPCDNNNNNKIASWVILSISHEGTKYTFAFGKEIIYLKGHSLCKRRQVAKVLDNLTFSNVSLL